MRQRDSPFITAAYRSRSTGNDVTFRPRVYSAMTTMIVPAAVPSATARCASPTVSRLKCRGSRIGATLEEPPGRDTWVGYHRDLRRLARLRALLDLVIERLAG